MAVEIRNAWLNIGTTETFGGITCTEFTAALTALDTAETAISSVQDQLTNARNPRDANRLALWNLVKRAP